MNELLRNRLRMGLPVVQAPIGSASTAELAAAVSNAGGLGMLAMSWRTPVEVELLVQRTRRLTSRAFGANLVVDRPQFERLEVCLQNEVEVVSTFWGDPAPYTSKIHAAGAVHFHTVGSADEARRAVAVGVDVIVAQGWEAGGHVWGQVASLPLIPAVVDAIRPVPVLAAGGIADGRGLAAVLALGAAGAWVGSRYLLAHEADVHPRYRSALVSATECDTFYGVVFDGGWPEAPHRGLNNRTVANWEAAGRPIARSRPGHGDIVATSLAGVPLHRYGDDLPTLAVTGAAEEMALYAGQSAALLKATESADAITRSLAREAYRILRGPW